MKTPASVEIVGTPVACEAGLLDTWRELAEWTEDQLKARFGDNVLVQYYDLFDAGCPAIPPQAQIPLVFVNGEVLISGGKISIPMIRKRLQELGYEPSSITVT